ncbi:MAG: hypothetical protein K8S23_08885 [Candidatus Cloacimonetes bacterium]|nr:hypothetical protein [Candidatus Cloacimonadota bacterium]
MKFFILLLLLIFLSTNTMAYETPKKPLKAAIFSLVLPGGGQYYNGSKMKFAFVFAVESSLIGITSYHIYRSERYYNKYKSSLNETDYQNYLKYYYKLKNDYWWIGTTVILSMIDAYVDAHLSDYDEKKRKIHLKFSAKAIGFQYDF